MNVSHDLNIKTTQADMVIVAVVIFFGGRRGEREVTIHLLCFMCVSVLYCQANTSDSVRVTLVETSNSRHC